MMRPRDVIYNALVNKHSGISARYHKVHNGTTGGKKLFSWVYLLWLNFAYYVFQCRFLGCLPQANPYESKRLFLKSGESVKHQKQKYYLAVSDFVEKLMPYDVVSFDIFDTLIFRPLSMPTDLFYLVGQKLGIMNFKNIRVWAESDVRIKYCEKWDNMEIGLSDIWEYLEEDLGVSAKLGAAVETETEKNLCYANPFMLEVWKRLEKSNKKRIIISDMYLPKECIAEILEKAGYTGAQKIYISNEYHRSKASGTLYRKVIQDLYGIDTKEGGVSLGKNIAGQKNNNVNSNGFSIVHVGDNPHSDVKMARRCGLDVLPYQNVNKDILLYRAFDMSPIIGSAYRAIVNNRLYCGLESYSMLYEYGYIYGGLFVLGYCNFIHDYVKQNQVEAVLFLSRDGDTLKQAYDYLYPEEETQYVYWSRKAAVKLGAAFDKHDFFRRFIYHKINQKYTLKEILNAMELSFLAEELEGGEPKKRIEKPFMNLRGEDELTQQNASLLRQFIEAKWDEVQQHYRGQSDAAGKYFESVLGTAKKAVAVDIGWAGSGAMVLRRLVSDVWQIPCEIVGIIAGTNTIHNSEADASEGFLQSGELVAYLYSQAHNRDLLKKHDANKNYNVFWELLLSSPTPQFQGFYPGNTGGSEQELVSSHRSGETVYLRELDITLKFGKYDKNREGIREIQKGILDFVRDYHIRFKEYPYMFRVSGRDAYAPMLAASGYGERYLREIEKNFSLQINVD